ncbi:hypothetical protein [Actinomadura sp. LOL_011]|uniref:hypothetical protein n=1 Tax=Actinomadura sp. LOL_011 TaxID=3345410 RepID=UPI003A803DCB
MHDPPARLQTCPRGRTNSYRPLPGQRRLGPRIGLFHESPPSPRDFAAALLAFVRDLA